MCIQSHYFVKELKESNKKNIIPSNKKSKSSTKSDSGVRDHRQQRHHEVHDVANPHEGSYNPQ